MKAWFDDAEIGSSVFFLTETVERTIGGHGPPLGLTYTFNGGRKVPLVLDKVEDGQAYYKRFEKIEREKREEMPRAKKVKATVTESMPLNAAVAVPVPEVKTGMGEHLSHLLPKKAESPKYADMNTADELWELDFPDKPELFRQLIQERLDLKYTADGIDERIKEINNSLLPFFERNGLPGVKLEDGSLVRRHEGQSVTLNKEALVLAGVPADVIEKCTVRKRFVTVMVKGPKSE
jgi:hypothetical protein